MRLSRVNSFSTSTLPSTAVEKGRETKAWNDLFLFYSVMGLKVAKNLFRYEGVGELDVWRVWNGF